MTTYITADQHWGHENIIKLCYRPFKTLKEMNWQMADRWNRFVFPNDTVYCLGDMFWTMNSMKEILPQLSGHIIYVPSFERSHEKMMVAWNTSLPRNRIVYLPHLAQITIEKKLIILCHYPLLSWPKGHYGSWHLHGHIHKPMSRLGKVLNVGVDMHDFYPWSFAEIKEYMKDRK